MGPVVEPNVLGLFPEIHCLRMQQTMQERITIGVMLRLRCPQT